MWKWGEGVLCLGHTFCTSHSLIYLAYRSLLSTNCIPGPHGTPFLIYTGKSLCLSGLRSWCEHRSFWASPVCSVRHHLLSLPAGQSSSLFFHRLPWPPDNSSENSGEDKLKKSQSSSCLLAQVSKVPSPWALFPSTTLSAPKGESYHWPGTSLDTPKSGVCSFPCAYKA